MRDPRYEDLSPASALDISPDSRRLIIGDVYGRLLIFDPTDGRKVGSLPGHEKSIVTAVAFGGDVNTFVSAADDGRIVLWQLREGKRIREFVLYEEELALGARGVAVSPDAQRLLATNGAGAVLWDVTTGKRAPEYLHDGALIADGRFSSDGKVAFVGGGGFAAALDVATGKARWTLQQEGTSYKPVRFLPDTQEVLMETWPQEDGDPKYGVWHGPSGKRRFTLSYDKPVAKVAASADGKELVTLHYQGKVIRWDSRNGQRLATYDAEGMVRKLVAISPDKRLIAVSSTEGVIVLDTQTGKVRSRIAIKNAEDGGQEKKPR